MSVSIGAAGGPRAVGVPLRHVMAPRQKPIHSLIAALRARSRRSPREASPTPRHYPRREWFIENAAMEREMHRL